MDYRNRKDHNASITKIPTNNKKSQPSYLLTTGSRASHVNGQDTDGISNGAYEAFHNVDEMVSKPVLGSDGASRWQDFRNNNSKSLINTNIAAPKAPLKNTDRVLGFQSWDDERMNEYNVREINGQINTIGYTHFDKKGSKFKTTVDNNNEDIVLTAKERKRIENRRIAANQDYFISSKIFIGWKWDYIFTTRGGIDNRGTGYYYDGMDSYNHIINGNILLFEEYNKYNKLKKNNVQQQQQQQQQQQSLPVNANENKRSLSELNNTTVVSNHTTDHNNSVYNNNVDVTTNDSNGSKKRKKKPKITYPVIVDNVKHPMEQVAAALLKRQQQEQQHQQQQHPSTTNQNNNSMDEDEWQSAIDPTTNRIYYYNHKTGETSWEKKQKKSVVAVSTSSILPKKQKKVATITTPTTISSLLPDGWNSATDPTTGKIYYYHNISGETRWDRPLS